MSVDIQPELQHVLQPELQHVLQPVSVKLSFSALLFMLVEGFVYLFMLIYAVAYAHGSVSATPYVRDFTNGFAAAYGVGTLLVCLGFFLFYADGALFEHDAKRFFVNLTWPKQVLANIEHEKKQA
jgi:hypothetical protein